MPAFAAASRPRRRLLAAALAVAIPLAAASDAHAYVKPVGGAWTFGNLFDDTRSGALTLSKAGTQVTKLVAVPGERSVEECGRGAIRMTSRPKIRSWRSVNGRYAVAVNPSGLFRPTPAWFTRGGRRVRGKVMLLWDETGRLLDTGEIHLPGDCRIDFFASKRR
jgi:hypothetical protein